MAEIEPLGVVPEHREGMRDVLLTGEVGARPGDERKGATAASMTAAVP